ncbi:MAG: glycosyltransferase family 39 protein [Fuerstiella sp.]
MSRKIQFSKQIPFRNGHWLAFGLVVILHFVVQRPQEPVFNGDSNRHVMTSVFFRDFLVDQPSSAPRQYAEDYNEQYPALGLLVWPPMFHATSGLAMVVFGTSVAVPRVLVLLSCVLATWCLMRLCRRRMPIEQASFVAALFGLMPLVFEFSRYVMLEMPTLALCLLCLDQFDQWLAKERKRSLYLAAIAAAIAALTRFDAVVLVPMLIFQVAFQGQYKRLASRHILVAACLAIAIVAPTYILIWSELGELHMRQAAESVSGRESPQTLLGRILFYPSCVLSQVGWVSTFLVTVGIFACLRCQNRSALPVFASILLATFLTFTPLAELTSRHTIYWLPALAWLAAIGAEEFGHQLSKFASFFSRKGSVFVVKFCLLLATAITSFLQPVYRVTGYADAAQVAITHTEPNDRILIEGWWDGNITYHLRHLDPNRQRNVLRADKELYSFTNVPNVDFEQFVSTDHEILREINRLDARCIIFEDPQPYGEIRISEQMRRLIRSMPDTFPVIKTVQVQSTVPHSRKVQLFVFKVKQDFLKSDLTSGSLVK